MPKYNHIENLPAKVFFEILKSKDYQQLKPKPREKNLDKLFMSIYDDFFIRSNNEQANEYLRLQNVIAMNAYNIDILKNSLAFYYYNQTTEKMRQQYAEALKEGFNIDLDLTVPFRDEVKRILDFEVGLLENEISLATIDLNSLKKGSHSDDFNFYEQMIVMSNVLVGNTLIKENMTLAVYVALDKSIRLKEESIT